MSATASESHVPRLRGPRPALTEGLLRLEAAALFPLHDAARALADATSGRMPGVVVTSLAP